MIKFCEDYAMNVMLFCIAIKEDKKNNNVQIFCDRYGQYNDKIINSIVFSFNLINYSLLNIPQLL